MDQQFQQYEQFFKSLFGKVRGAVLRTVEPKIRWRIFLFCGFFIVYNGIPLFKLALDYTSFVAYGDEDYLSIFLYLSIYPMIPFAAAVLMLFGNRIGWFILSTYVVQYILGLILTLTYESLWMVVHSEPILIHLDRLTGYTPESIIVSILIYSGVLSFMCSSAFRKAYRIEKKMLWIPIVLGGALMASQYFLGMI